MQNVNFTNIIPFSPLPHLWHTKRYQGSPQDRPCPIPTILREGQETLVDVVKMKMVLSGAEDEPVGDEGATKKE